MVALSLQGGRKKISEVLTEGVVLSKEFVISEVLNMQEPSMKNFLMDICILTQFSVELCDAIIDRPISQKKIKELIEKDLFIEPLDLEGKRFRFHSIFRDALYQTQQNNNPSRLVILHKKASKWFQEHDCVNEAIEHALSAKDYKQACTILGHYSHSLLEKGIPKQAHDWLIRIPDEYITNDLPLCVLALYVSAFPFYKSKSKEHYYRLAKSLSQRLNLIDITPESESLTALAWLTLYEATELYIYKGNTKQAIDLLQNLLQRIPSEDTIASRIILMGLSHYYLIDGRLAKAYDINEKMKSISIIHGIPLFTMSAIAGIACIRFSSGNLISAMEACKEAILHGTDNSGKENPNLWYSHILAANIFYQWNQLDKAKIELLQAFKLSEQLPESRYHLMSTLFLARLEKANNQSSTALDLCNRAQNEVGQIGDTESVPCCQVNVYNANLWIQIGNVAAAKDYARTWSKPIDLFRINLNKTQNTPVEIHNDLYGVLYGESWIGKKVTTYLRLKIAAKEYDGLEDLFNALLKEVKTNGWISNEIELRVLLALFFQAKQNDDKALKELSTVFKLTENENWIRIFIDEGAPLYRLLQKAKSQGFESPQLLSLLAEFSDKEAKERSYSGKNGLSLREDSIKVYYEPLTAREQEILNMVSRGMSNQQIASSLILALQSVKNQISTIYQKLGVNNRVQASIRAKELGLIQ